MMSWAAESSGTCAAGAATEPELAGRAVVRRAAADDDPRYRAAAARAGLALAGVDEELFLHRAHLATAVAVVVDRCAAALEAGFQGGDDPVAECLEVLRAHR